MNDSIEKVRESLKYGDYEVEANIRDITVTFPCSEKENVTDEYIEFALDLVNGYLSDKRKFDDKALDEVRKCLEIEEEQIEVDDSTIRDQLGTPMIGINTERSASFYYGGVEEVGDHMPEVRVDRSLSVYDVVLNG